MNLELKIRERGFTLVELLVVVAIISGLAGIFVPKFLNYSNFQELQNAAADLHSQVRLAQNNAQSGVICSKNISSSTWYLKFESDSSYKIETTCVGSNVEAGTPTPTPPQSTSYKMNEGIKIASIDLVAGSSTCSTQGSEVAGFGVSFSSISGAVRLISGSPGCPVNNSTSRMVINLASS